MVDSLERGHRSHGFGHTAPHVAHTHTDAVHSGAIGEIRDQREGCDKRREIAAVVPSAAAVDNTARPGSDRK